MDELGYERMAQSFAHTGHFSLFGKGGLAYSPLYPIVLSPIYALTSSMHTAYEWAKVENAVLISLSVFPVYGIARFVLPRGRSIGVAALSLLAPLMLYSGFEMSREPRLSPLPRRDVGDAARRPPAERGQRRASARRDRPRLRRAPPARGAATRSADRHPARRLLSTAWAAASRRLTPVDLVSRARLLFGSSASRSSPCSRGRAMNGGNLPLAGRYANVGTAHASAVRVVRALLPASRRARLGGRRDSVRRRATRGLSLSSVSGFPETRSSSPPSRLHRRSGSCSRSPSMRRPSTRPALTRAMHRPSSTCREFTSAISSISFRSSSSRCSRRSVFADRASQLSGISSAAAIVAALLPALIPFGTVINGTSAIDSFALQLFGTTRGGTSRADRARDHVDRRTRGPSRSRLPPSRRRGCFRQRPRC